MQTLNIITLGCSKNTVDTEWLATSLSQNGYNVSFDNHILKQDIILINTCGFIGDAKEQSIDTIIQVAEAKKQGDIKKIIVFGCLAERYKQTLTDEIPEVDAFFGVHEWENILLELGVQDSFPHYENRLISTPSHYAYLKIAEGCNRRCSFCAIPNIRGKYISRPEEDIIEEAFCLKQQGVKEILLIAQDTTFYGKDLYHEHRLPKLLRKLAEDVNPDWLRLHYMYPQDLTEEMVEVMATYNNICKYIDLPLQHINSRLLASMHRHIDREGTYKVVDTIRKRIPNVALRTTLIVGYPNETEKEFQELKEFVADIRFDRLGIFTYSPEEGTPAFHLKDNVLNSVKQRRADELMELQQSISLDNNTRKIGKIFPTLIDRHEGEYSVGRTEFDSPEVDNEVLIEDTSLSVGTFYPVKILSATEFDLIGKIEK